MTVVFRNAVTLVDAMGMRRVRNTCRDFMTRDQSKISIWRQMWWWWTMPFNFKPMVVEEGGRIVGYGLVIQEDGYALVTGGLLPSHRGRGIGTQLFEYLAMTAESLGVKAALEVLPENHAGLRVYRKLGFVETRRCGGIIEMERPCRK
jgi:ribosomal protein S18 acetylase RimI-like enzyme